MDLLFLQWCVFLTIFRATRRGAVLKNPTARAQNYRNLWACGSRAHTRVSLGEGAHVAQRQNSRRMAHACASVIGRLHYYTYWTYPTHRKALRHSHPPLVAPPHVAAHVQPLGRHRRARSLSSGASCRPHAAPEGAWKGHGRWLSVASQPSTFAVSAESGQRLELRGACW